MHFITACLMALSLTTALVEAEKEPSTLFSEAALILDTMPMFSSRTGTDQPLVLEIQMDFDFESERRRYNRAMTELTDSQTTVLSLLQKSAAGDNVDANFMLAEMNMYGNYSFPRNGSLALQYYHKVAELSPNATAYYNLGFIYATGLFGEVERDQAKANLYYQFAFEQGDMRAAMVLGYRHMYNIGVPHDCQKSHFYYQVAADYLMDMYKKAPLGGPILDSFNIRVSDFQDGIYGKGVGDTPSSLKRKANRYDSILHTDALADEYSLYDQLYFSAVTNYEGSYTKPRRFTKAYKYAKMAYEEGTAEVRTLQPYEKYYVARCIYLMGHMHLRGEGVEQNFDEAQKYLKKSLEFYNLTEAHTDLLLIYDRGPEHLRNQLGVMAHLKNSSASAFNAAKMNYGKLADSFDLAKDRYAVGLEAYYYHAEYLDRLDEDKCSQAVFHLKHFVEAFDPSMTSLEWAYFEMLEGRSSNALIGYAMAAEQGFEMAQASAAFLMYQPPGLLEEPPKIPPERREMAMVYTTRSSAQHNLDSTVLLGDMYFGQEEYDKAVNCYESASSARSSQAYFNLAWMHEMGLGVEQDFHLAKRYYDLALDGHSKAYLPVQISLVRLTFKGLVNSIIGKKGTTVDPTKEEKRTWSDWLSLYNKVRGSTQLPSDYEQEVESTLTPAVTEPQEDVILNEDVIIVIFFAGAFAMFLTVYMLQQRQLRRRLAEAGVNVPQPRPEIRVQFGFFAI